MTDPWSPGKPVADSLGVSVMCVDPGQESGWWWAVVPHAWLLSLGVHRSITEAVARSFTDRGQVLTPHHDHLFESEARHVSVLASVGRKCDEATRTHTDGRLGGLSHVLVEDFILREHSSDRSLLSPVRLTSALYQELSHSHLGSCAWHIQSASDKSVVGDELLRSLGMYRPGWPHANDAARHLVLFLRKYVQQLR